MKTEPVHIDIDELADRKARALLAAALVPQTTRIAVIAMTITCVTMVVSLAIASMGAMALCDWLTISPWWGVPILGFCVFWWAVIIRFHLRKIALL